MTGDATAAQGIGALEIATRSGSVTVHARPIDRPEVLKGPAEIGPDGVVRSGSSNRVEIACPEGTDVVIGTSSGRVVCTGRLGRVAVTGGSGGIRIEQALEVDVRATSGRVRIERCAGLARVTSVSGRVDIGVAGAVEVTLTSGRVDVLSVRDALVHSGSGRVTLATSGPGAVEVSTVSGRAAVSVPPGVAPVLALTSRSGRIRTEVEAGPDGSVTVETVSGSITVTQA